MAKNRFFKSIADKLPELGLKLIQAGMADTPEEFVKKTVFSASYMTVGVCFLIFMLFSKLGKSVMFLIGLFPLLLVMMFFYFLKFPDVKIMKLQKQVDREIVFAGQFLIIELESGIGLYESFIHVARNYPTIGRYFRNVIEDIDLGTPIDEALNKAVETTPSQNLRKMFWQITNSITTGADVATALTSVVEQIIREQKIELNEYGRKLNPLAMFYMIIAIVLPSIGITMFVVLVSFLSIKLSLLTLLLIAVFMGFIQFMFYTIVKSSRPASQFE